MFTSNRLLIVSKAAIMLLAADCMRLQVVGQGMLDSSALLFRNGTGGGIPNRPIIDGATGEPLAVVGAMTPFTVQLYWSSTEPVVVSDLVPTDNITSIFAAPGIFISPGSGRIPATPGNYWFQVKVWETEFGRTFEEASLQPEAQVGESNIFMLQTVEFGADFPLALSQGGLESFEVNPIPEPEGILLLLLGASALLIARRLTTDRARYRVQ